MQSMISKVLRDQIRLIKPILTRMTIEEDRRAQDRIGELYARPLEDKFTANPASFADFEAEMLTPKYEEPCGGVILYLHGGGYTAGSLRYARGFGSLLCTRLSRRIFCVGYRLAPEHPFPAALEDAFCAYTHLLTLGFLPEDISLIGESAGGGLIFCLMHYLKEKGMPLPAKIVAISPWTDLSFSGRSHHDNAEIDPSLSYEQILHSARLYAGEDVINPLVSPIYGDFSGFPPALLFVGSDEILLDDARFIEKQYIKYGGDCRLTIAEHLWHVYVLFSIPEAKAALSQIESFLSDPTTEAIK